MSSGVKTSGAAPVRSALVFWGIGAVVVLLFVLVNVAAQALLLAFAGVLFGTALRGLAAWLAAKLGWRVGWSLAACIGGIAVIATVAALWIAPRIDDQLAELTTALQHAYDRVRQEASGSQLGRRLVSGSADLEQGLAYLSRAAGLLMSVVGAVIAIVFVVVFALYFAGAPDPYRRGVVRLVPPAHRARAQEVIDALGVMLRRWVLGRLVSMTAVGTTISLGLWIGGIPLPITLGLLSGLLGFIPNIGAIVAAVPAILLAFTVSPMHAVYVLVLSVAVNFADGYGLTPLIEKRAVSTPAALVMVSQLVFGALWGLLGVTLATPLLACLLVLVRMLYVEDMIERQHHGPRDHEPA
ncbi:MAG: AI-2E family transporter [Kofleriaceae bacterium]